MSTVLRPRGRHCAPPRRPGAHRAPARRGPIRTATIGATSILAVGVIGGGAYAFWSGLATGDAKAEAATAKVLTVAAGTAGTALFPGATTNVNFVVSNGNPYPVKLDTLTGATVTSNDEASCPADTHLTLGALTGFTAMTVGAGSSTSGTLSGFVTMKTAAPDACQGKTFTIRLSFSGTQV